jgi:PDZ domain-containing secreted protein
MSVVLNVFFDDRCWVALFTATDGNTEKYAWVLFEKEPSDVELHKYVLENYNNLMFSDIHRTEGSRTPVKNPKRRQKEIGKEIHDGARIKKSYDAIKLSIQNDDRKQRRVEKKLRKQNKDDHVFDSKQKKRKEKHRGR